MPLRARIAYYSLPNTTANCAPSLIWSTIPGKQSTTAMFCVERPRKRPSAKMQWQLYFRTAQAISRKRKNNTSSQLRGVTPMGLSRSTVSKARNSVTLFCKAMLRMRPKVVLLLRTLSRDCTSALLPAVSTFDQLFERPPRVELGSTTWGFHKLQVDALRNVVFSDLRRLREPQTQAT